MTDNNEQEVASPCRSLCQLDPHNICIGCYRKSAEINFWTTYSNKEKLEVIKKAEERRMQADIKNTLGE